MYSRPQHGQGRCYDTCISHYLPFPSLLLLHSLFAPQFATLPEPYTLLFPYIDNAYLITLPEMPPHGQARRPLLIGLWCSGAILTVCHLYWSNILRQFRLLHCKFRVLLWMVYADRHRVPTGVSSSRSLFAGQRRELTGQLS
jgi:hypothetical protein